MKENADGAPGVATATETCELDEMGFPVLRSTDIVIAVMGVTGVGKSTFISHFNTAAKIGNTMFSETSEVETHEATIDGQRFYLVDTPGFNDTNLNDVDILRKLAAWLNQKFKEKVCFAGIIYLHSIAESRMTGSAMKNLRMFKQLCGEGALKRVVLGTTMWDQVPKEVGERREDELRTEKAFWADLIEKGSKIIRHDNDEHSARRIIEHIQSRYADPEYSAVNLKIQTEMAAGKTLDQTSAGLEVEAQREKLMAKHQDEMRLLQEEWKETQEARDTEAKKELESLKAELEAKMKKEREDSQRMRVTVEQLQQERSAEQQKLRDALEKFQQQQKAGLQRELETAQDCQQMRDTIERLQQEQSAENQKLRDTIKKLELQREQQSAEVQRERESAHERHMSCITSVEAKLNAAKTASELKEQLTIAQMRKDFAEAQLKTSREETSRLQAKVAAIPSRKRDKIRFLFS